MTESLRRSLRNPLGTVALTAMLVCLGCQTEEAEAPPTVDVIAEDYEFTVSDTVPAGWVRLRMHNQGTETHYLEIDRLPKDVSVAQYGARVERIGALYDSLTSLLAEGAIDRAEAVRQFRAAVPDTSWGGDRTDLGVDAGGVGLLGPGETAQTTLRLEPGTHSLICLMPTSDGEPHLARGMIAPLVVSEPASGATPPTPDVVMRYAGGKLSTENALGTGPQVVAIHVDDAGSSESIGKVGAYLAELDDTTRAENLVRWVTEGGYRPPAPTTFLGGVDEIPEGDSAYVTVDLEAGRYGWVIAPFGSDVEPFVEELRVE